MGRSVDEHARAVAAAVRSAATRRAHPPLDLAVDDVRGGRLAEAVVAALDVPGFDNSQMDGFAVHTTDLARAGDGPVTLSTVAHVVAGGDAPPPLSPGSVAPIMTGAPVPPGADAIVPIEHTSGGFGPVEGGGVVTFGAAVEPGAFVRRRGADLRAGDVLLEAGAPLGPAALGALVAAGVDRVRVVPPPRLALVATGSEVTRGDVPDSNTAVLLAHARELGIDADVHRVEDDPSALTALLDLLVADHDLVVTTGGVSAGAREVVRQALADAPDAWFGHVDVQPGGPQGLAWTGTGEHVIPVACLPGNPVSVLVSFELFLRAPLAESVGLPPRRESGTGALTTSLESPPGRLQVRRGRLEPDGRVSLVGGPGSHLVASYARANVLVLVPETVTSLSAGDTVEWWRIA